jgi:hypothetical protein
VADGVEATVLRGQRDNVQMNAIRIGRCIYCGNTERPLRREHMIAAGLNGPWVLQDACCRACEKVTSAFEGHVLGGPFRLARAGLKMHTGHGFPTTASLLIDRGDGAYVSVDVPVKDYPVLVQFVEFSRPAHLDTRPYTGGIDISGCRTIQVAGPDPKEVGRRLGAKGMRWVATYERHYLPRLIAKIAYTFLVSDVGLDGIDVAYVLPAILGQSQDIGRWVGCDEMEYITDPRLLHGVSQAIVNNEVITRVRLFASYRAPEYVVAVGRVREGASRGKFKASGPEGFSRTRTNQEVQATAQRVPEPFTQPNSSQTVRVTRACSAAFR